MFYFTNPVFSVLSASIFIILSIFSRSALASKKVGIIVPIEHEAMTEIVSGIKEVLSATDTKIVVQNAQGDYNIQLSLIRQMKGGDIDIIMPIGTIACQMTISHITNKPIICVAAAVSIDAAKYPLVTGVNDEIPIASSVAKFPKLRHLAVIYSANEKIAPEIELLQDYSEKNNITLHLAMIQTLVDLPSALKTAPRKTQAFLVLKDHMIVSAIGFINNEAAKRSIPVIASDEGSVHVGATMAIGVHEKDIGIKAGEIAKSVINGTKPCDIPYQTISNLAVFFNKDTFNLQNILQKKDLINLSLPIVEFSKKN